MQSIFSLPIRRPITPPPAAQRSDHRSDHPRSGLPASSSPATKGKLVASPAMRQVAAADAEPPAPVSAKAKWHGTYKRVRDMLAARYPLIFSYARPLKVGIHRDLRAAIPEDELSTTDLRHFLYKWVRRPPYLDALARGVRRVDLEGNDAGPAAGAPEDLGQEGR